MPKAIKHLLKAKTCLNAFCVFALLVPIYFYRFALSPLIGANCRFSPTCSGYAICALRQHGALKGGYLAVRRILTCHPWGGQGYDPVPPADNRPFAHHPFEKAER